MARRARVVVPGVWRHMMQRGDSGAEPLWTTTRSLLAAEFLRSRRLRLVARQEGIIPEALDPVAHPLQWGGA